MGLRKPFTSISFNVICVYLRSESNDIVFDGQIQDEFRELMAPLDDVVMGGVSQSFVTLSDDGASMTGTTSARNNGGFCSCRSPRSPLPPQSQRLTPAARRTRNVDPAFDLTGYEGVAVRLRSDVSMRYKIILRDAEGWDTVAWCHSFDLPAGKVPSVAR